MPVMPRKSQMVVLGSYSLVALWRRKPALPIVCKFVNSPVVCVPPRIMGVGPAFTNPKVLNLVDITKDEVDFYEINKAFLYSTPQGSLRKG
jgi:acetyl-CoA acetyltransferase